MVKRQFELNILKEFCEELWIWKFNQYATIVQS